MRRSEAAWRGDEDELRVGCGGAGNEADRQWEWRQMRRSGVGRGRNFQGSKMWMEGKWKGGGEKSRLKTGVLLFSRDVTSDD